MLIEEKTLRLNLEERNVIVIQCCIDSERPATFKITSQIAGTVLDDCRKNGIAQIRMDQFRLYYTAISIVMDQTPESTARHRNNN